MFGIGLWVNLFAQDTIFVAKHPFGTPVRNVFSAEGDIYVKTVNSLYRLSDSEWESQKMTFKKAYVFFDERFYEADFIPKSMLFDIGPIKELVPQKGKFIATAARKGSQFFVASGSELFEYEIRDHYSKSYHNHSIRDIYIDPQVKVVSTYSGIYVNDTIVLPHPTYSNGPLVRIDSAYYLSWDQLSRFFPPDSTSQIPEATSVFSGKARKLVKWDQDLYALNTKSVSKVLPGFVLTPLHQGLDYLDLEVAGDRLVFSTQQGLCFTWDGSQADTLANIPSQIRDILVAGEELYLSSDLGVYKVNFKDAKTLEKIADTPNTVMTQFDFFGILWISTENGLYACRPDLEAPIAVIPGVEFNREALLLQDEVLYVGAVDGLYTVNTYEISKTFIPKVLSTVSIPLSQKYPLGIWVSGFSSVVVLGGLYFFLRKKKLLAEAEESTPSKEWNLQELETRILAEKIQTVDAMAVALDTNTVQLNRNLKKLGTTPGKFLKQVKLRKAEELLKSGVNLQEVAIQVGYSIKFLKHELGI